MKKFNDCVPTDLIEVQKLAYEQAGFKYKNLVIESESQEYAACEFQLNNLKIKFRVGKITPTKIGQFVTFWKRGSNGSIEPYDLSDHFDLLVISCNDKEHFGQFVFPKNVLLEKDIISKNKIGGKRAIRVYPPWDKAENLQAKKTQAWQLMYFFEIKPNIIDNDRIKKLFS